MKKKVIAVLLASMMATSMVPVTAMAEEQPLIESTEDTQDLAEEAEAEGEAEDVFAEESEAEGADAEEAEDLEQSEDALEISQEAEDVSEEEADPFGLSDGTAVFSDAEGTVTINGVSFDTTKTYIVPLTLKNAHNLDQDSAAVACPGKFGTLTFEADGTAKISTNLRSVTVGTLTDYAYDFKVYQGVKPSGDTVAADVVATQNVPKADGSGNHDVPETISFTIPKDTYSNNGVYLSMYVDAMGYAPDAFLQIDYAEKKESGDPSLNFTTEVSTAEVEQFGNYNVTSQVTVKDGRITDVALAGNDFKGTHADDNQMYLNKAINGLGSTKGMKEKLTGLYMNDAQKLNDLDTVTGATYSSNAIKNATMNALGVKIEQEVIPDAPSEKPAAGLYYIEMKDRTDVVDHGLVGESKKAGAYLRVDDAGKMWLTYKMVSGTTGEPLYVLGYNGYYPNGDTSKALSMEGVTYSTEKMTAPTIGDCSVVTDITVPLDGISQTYVNNVALYVEAMKNLNGEVSGVNFDHGKFNINSTITLYWDTLDNLSEGTNAAKLATLSDGVYKLNGQMVKVNKVDMSMSNNAINHNVKLVMKDGLPYISMNFNSLTVGSLKGYLKDLSYYATGYTVSKTGEPSGTLLPVQVDSLQKFSNGKTLKDDFGTNYPNDVTFPLCQEAMTEENGEYVPMQVFVPIMDAITAGTGKQNVYLKLDYSTLKKTTADDKDFAETEKAPTDPSAIKAQTITVTVKNTKGVVSKKYGDKAFSLGAKAKTGLTYKSSNTKIATVDSKGKVTIKGVGTVKITITAKASTSYKAATKTMTIKVAKATPVLKTKITSKAVSYSALRKKSQVFTLGASTSSKGTLTYAKASGSSAFTVNRTNGKITVKKGLKKGTYKIKVKIYSKATTRYNAGSKTVLVTVKVK